MLDGNDLLELLRRSHRGTRDLLEHCSKLSVRELNKELPEFSFPCLRLLLHHIMEADEYWMLVLRGEFREETAVFMKEENCRTVQDLQAYLAHQEQMAADTLPALDAAWLSTPREFLTWPNNKRVLLPSMIVMRIVTHHFHHRGQAASICRMLGHPAEMSLDFPLAPFVPN